MRGTLEGMCSAEEVARRVTCRDIHPLELDTDGKPTLCVKQYSRSAAGRQYKSRDIRSLASCATSRTHLLSLIDAYVLDGTRPRVGPKDLQPDKIWQFVLDRYLQLRIDLHMQCAHADGAPERSHNEIASAHRRATVEHLLIAHLAAALGHHHLARNYIPGILSALRDVSTTESESDRAYRDFVCNHAVVLASSTSTRVRLLYEADDVVHFMRCVRTMASVQLVVLSVLLVEVRHMVLTRLLAALRLVERRRSDFFEDALCLPTGSGTQYMAECGFSVDGDCVILTPGQEVSLETMARVAEPMLNKAAIGSIAEFLEYPCLF